MKLTFIAKVMITCALIGLVGIVVGFLLTANVLDWGECGFGIAGVFRHAAPYMVMCEAIMIPGLICLYRNGDMLE